MPEPRGFTTRAFGISAALGCLAALLDADEDARVDAVGLGVIVGLLAREAEALGSDLLDADFQRAA